MKLSFSIVFKLEKILGSYLSVMVNFMYQLDWPWDARLSIILDVTVRVCPDEISI